MEAVPPMTPVDREAPPDWEEARPFFLRDGFFRDIYGLGDGGLWRAWLGALVINSWPLTWRQGDEAVGGLTDFPVLAEHDETFAFYVELLSGPQINTYFFGSDEIDADLIPQDFVREDQRRELLAFIKFMGEATGGVTSLCAEGCRNEPWLVYRPHADRWTTYGDPTDHVVAY